VRVEGDNSARIYATIRATVHESPTRKLTYPRLHLSALALGNRVEIAKMRKRASGTGGLLGASEAQLWLESPPP
jgi:hypothetical protein